ncbi:Hypothetical protein PHPALM_7421 [Phytophthora palmivora]|uniref:Exonuclease 1 n=1 Tax=Phytophthora palmivora TaxID=4796 RepID=A0A2P4YCQ4_9STRA|nr:Hypothetical protein PHPALM_7421 [Phytophthora palmivora]
MGVDGFLRQLSEAVDKTHLQQFANQTLVVDALSWLHKACYGCAFELSTGRDTDKYVQYMLRKVDMMRSCGVAKVILVFDGQRLPLKSSTQEKRQRYKEENRKRALEAMTASKRLQGADRQDEVNKAYQLFQRSVSITPEIISTVMNALRAARVPFVVQSARLIAFAVIQPPEPSDSAQRDAILHAESASAVVDILRG